MDDLRVLAFFYIIEGALVGYVGLALIGIRLNLKQFIAVGVLQGLVVYLVRGIYTVNKLPFGTHLFFNLAGFIIILHFLTKQRWSISMLGGLLGFITIILSEMFMLPPLYAYLKLNTEKVWSDTWVHIATGYLGDWLLILTAAILFFSRKSLVNLQKNNVPGFDR